MEFLDVVAARRSAYSLDDAIDAAGVTEDDVTDALRRVITRVPSAFNMRSVRTVVLFGDDHRTLWRNVEGILRARMEGRDFSATEAKVRSFAAAAGTILFYEDTGVVRRFMEGNPRYAENFPVWSEQGSGMAQYAAWLTLYDLGLGANIQHYNPLIDGMVAETFGIPEGLRLTAQMVFGRVVSAPGPVERTPGEEAVAVGRESGGAE